MTTAYDLLVIGAGPAGESGATEARRLGKTVALIDSRVDLGGNCAHTGTLPSKTLRESSLALSHAVDHAFLPPVIGEQVHPITMADFTYRAHQVISREAARMRQWMERGGVTVFNGTARFLDAHTVSLGGGISGAPTLAAEHVLIACGSRPLRPANIPFDGRQVFDSDQILDLERLPKSLIVVGAGVIGSEYATIFSNLGIPVQLVDAKPVHLPVIDPEIIARLHREIAKRPLTLELGVKTEAVALVDGEVRVTLAGGRTLSAEALLYASGRIPNVDGLDLAKAGVICDARSTITVDKHYHTNIPHISAAGDVIGFPALASASWDQGRSAVRELFGLEGTDPQKILPYGIYTIPEISTVGVGEAEAGAAGAATVVGRCEIGNTSRGIISGDQGLLKLVFDRTTRLLLGAQCIGARATDIIHIAMMCIRLRGAIEDLTESVFNYPTVSDAIKAAALDALWQLEAAKAAKDRHG
jgi:NAD(P) transhydrogenase